MSASRGEPSASDLLAEMREASTNDELRRALQRARQALARKQAAAAELEATVYQAAYDAAISVEPLPPAPARDRRTRRSEVALLHLTDWQWGKETTSFNSEIVGQRVDTVIQRCMSIVDVVRSGVPVRECHVMLGGDMVDGLNIFPGQAWEVDATLYDQMFGVAAKIAAVLRDLTGVFDVVHVWPEYGNHGRLGRIGEAPPSDNIDRMAYGIARIALGPDPQRIVWHQEWSWHQIVEIGEYRALLVHGDEVRSFGGNHPSYGILKRVMGWKAGGGVAPFRDAYFGHFHRPDTYTLPDGGSVFLTGSIESGNEYAASAMGATGVPQQRLHFIDPEGGRVTAEYRVYAT